jgi:Tol biopolymer transport system component
MGRFILQRISLDYHLVWTCTSDLQPAFSPDGTKIAFSSFRDGNAEVYTMNSNGSGIPANLTKYNAADSQPAFSPDGKQITFVSNRFGYLDIFVMNADGSGLDDRTFGGDFYAPDWGPKP